MDSQKSSTVGCSLVLSRVFLVVMALGVAAVSDGQADEAAERLLAGAYAVDITPTELPVIINGGFLERTAARQDRSAIVPRRVSVLLCVGMNDDGNRRRLGPGWESGT
ncbi:MAG: hypothetical protein ACUVXJ_16625, partial [Phycisphaerae bacterium]